MVVRRCSAGVYAVEYALSVTDSHGARSPPTIRIQAAKTSPASLATTTDTVSRMTLVPGRSSVCLVRMLRLVRLCWMMGSRHMVVRLVWVMRLLGMAPHGVTSGVSCALACCCKTGRPHRRSGGRRSSPLWRRSRCTTTARLAAVRCGVARCGRTHVQSSCDTHSVAHERRGDDSGGSVVVAASHPRRDSVARCFGRNGPPLAQVWQCGVG